MGISGSRLFLLIVAGLSVALFLPIMGRGFIHDDFIHLHSVAYHSLRQGLTRANGGPFYTPVAWLTFKLDWILWGKNPFLLAAGNLSLHIANVTLLYAFALKLWRSQIAARWAALGFTLLFPANTWAVMWISTRAHLLVMLFYLATLLATLWLAGAERHRKSAVAAITLFSILSMFSKESGVTAPAAVAITLIYVRLSRGRKILSPATVIALLGSLTGALAIYAMLRERSGAIPITFSTNDWYSYAASLNVLFENLFRYGWRTFGLLGIMACAIALSQIIRGRRPRLASIATNDALFSAALFATAIAPFVLLRGRSGIYIYLPGIAAALLLGSVARAFYEAPSDGVAGVMRHGMGRLLAPGDDIAGASKLLAPHIYAIKLSRPCKWLAFFRRSAAKKRLNGSKLLPQSLNLPAMTPILLVIALYSLLTVIHGLRWMRMAEINTFVLNQIAERVINPQPNTMFVLTYSEADNANGFPDSLAHGFSCALRMTYADPTLNGSIGRHGESRFTNLQAPVIRLAYIHGDGAPRLIVSSDEFCFF